MQLLSLALLLARASLVLADAFDISTMSPNELLCRNKSTSTGSGAHEAVKGFRDRDTLVADSELAHNGYTAGGFKPSEVTSTTYIVDKGCTDSGKGGDGEVCIPACLEKFWEVCAQGDGKWHGKGDHGCQ
jgi:hypothetical protein